MKVKWIKLPWLHVRAITFGKYVFYVGEFPGPILRNHEKIHVAQYAELGFFTFLLLYLLDFFKAYFKYRNYNQAYMRIRFEQEAYSNQHKPNYLEEREEKAWKKYTI